MLPGIFDDFVYGLNVWMVDLELRKEMDEGINKFWFGIKGEFYLPNTDIATAEAITSREHGENGPIRDLRADFVLDCEGLTYHGSASWLCSLSNAKTMIPTRKMRLRIWKGG